MASGALNDMRWLADHGDPALSADLIVALGALRAAVNGARANAAYDLSRLVNAGYTKQQVRNEHRDLWNAPNALGSVLVTIDELTADFDPWPRSTGHSPTG